MRRIFSKFGGAEYDPNGTYTGYRYTPGSDQDPAVIASKITDWSNVTDPLICWHDPIFSQKLTSDNWDAYMAATDRCMGRAPSAPYYGSQGTQAIAAAAAVNNNPTVYIGNTPLSQLQNNTLNVPGVNIVSSTAAVPVINSIVNPPIANSLSAPVSNAISTVTQSPLLLLAVIGVTLYFAGKK